jgi:ribosomal protein L11 methyltransferase
MQVTAYVDASVVDSAIGVLAAEGLASELRDATTLDRAPPGTIELVVWLDAAAGGPASVGGALARAGIPATVESVERDDDAWRDTWKEFFRPRRVGRFVIVPSWERFEPGSDDIVLRLDPGRAFGTGGHASTRLCLEAISAHAGCESFLDVGCGSGVLAIACARRWPEARGVALDIDPEAIEVTVENAARNGVGERIDAQTRDLAGEPGRFDLVLANLSSEVLGTLGRDLAARVAPGGRLVVSGILADEGDAVAARLGESGLSIVCARDEEEWRALELAR